MTRAPAKRAREAARRRGLTIGEWLNQAILANEAALAAVRAEASPHPTPVTDDALSQALAALSERVDANDRRAALAINTMGPVPLHDRPKN